MARAKRERLSHDRKEVVTISRSGWLLAGVAIAASCFWAGERLSVAWDGDDLRVAAPQLHFLAGKPLDRLKDGAAVVFLTQLTLTTDNFTTSLRRTPERFIFSYDLWEEKFSVTKLGERERTISHMSATAAEAWCLDNVAISSTGLPQDLPCWLRFTRRAAEPRAEAAVIIE